MKNWIKEHKKTCILLGILALIIVIAVIAGMVSGGKKQTDQQEDTATVEKRTLMESVSATGTFVAADEDKVSSDTTGVEVLAVNVEVGDTVSAGDVIAVLDSADLQKNLEDANKSLSDTNEQTQRTKDSATRNLEQAGRPEMRISQMSIPIFRMLMMSGRVRKIIIMHRLHRIRRR